MPVVTVDPDDYGFDLTGHDWTSFAQERVMLIGLDSFDRDLYYTCLMPFANKAGDVMEASYYRFAKMLTARRNPRGGRQGSPPKKHRMSDALDRLEAFGLLKLYRAESLREGVLKIRLIRRFGAISFDSVGGGVRGGSKVRSKRASMRPAG